MYQDLFIAALLLVCGNIFFGQFEIGTPTWRRLLKVVVFVGLTAAASAAWGHAGALGWVAFAGTLGLVAHFTWTRRHGINPWTAEPRARYRELRGWPAEG